MIFLCAEKFFRKMKKTLDKTMMLGYNILRKQSRHAMWLTV